jgi:CHAD domain-containing protein
LLLSQPENMDRKQIVEVIDTHFKNLNKILPKVQENFDKESIHHFRLETKKLRAFLRLCSVELNETNELRIPKKLKRFYGYIGIIENLQLQQQKLASILNLDPNDCDEKSYKNFLQLEEHYWKVQAKSLGDIDNFSDEKETIIDLLPYKISKETLKKFTNKKVQELNELMTSFNKDESLHRIRKIINDLIYNWPYIEPCAPLLTTGLIKKESLIEFSKLLSNFRNVSIALNLLNSTLRDNEKNHPESACLERIEAKWQTEKEQIKEQVYLKLLQLKFIPSSCY